MTAAVSCYALPVATIKAWGITRCLYRGPHTEVWHASIRAGGKSSFHCHAWKSNDFHVLEGILYVEHGGDVYTLQAGERLTIAARTWHQFRAATDVQLIEVYYLDPIDPDDIVREASNGR